MRCQNCGYELLGEICLKCNNDSKIITPTPFNPVLTAKLQNYDDQLHRRFTSKSEIDKSLHVLEGLLKGIAIDNSVNATELNEVISWYNLNKHHTNVHPFSELIPIITQSIEDDFLSQEEIKDMLWLCTRFSTDSIYYDAITSDIQRLQGILHGILADNDITYDEINGLRLWLNDNEHLASIYPYDEVYSLTAGVLSDGILSEDEKNLLKLFFSEFIDLRQSKTINESEINKLKKEICKQGICSISPELSFTEKQFCFTGKSSKTTRAGISEAIHALGGIYKDNVTLVTDYLVVGNEGNPCWAYSCYGRKVEQAIKLRKSGHRILIVHENDLWDHIADLR